MLCECSSFTKTTRKYNKNDSCCLRSNDVCDVCQSFVCVCVWAGAWKKCCHVKRLVRAGIFRSSLHHSRRPTHRLTEIRSNFHRPNIFARQSRCDGQNGRSSKFMIGKWMCSWAAGFIGPLDSHRVDCASHRECAWIAHQLHDNRLVLASIKMSSALAALNSTLV